jgi:hypothetical protein
MILAYRMPHKVGEVVLGVHSPHCEELPTQPAYILREATLAEWEQFCRESGFSELRVAEHRQLCQTLGYQYYYEVSVD